MKRKAVSTFRKERLWESHGTQPGSQKKYKTRENRESFKQSLKNYEEQITVPNWSQPAPDEHLNDLQKQGIPAVELKGVLFTDRIMETNR